MSVKKTALLGSLLMCCSLVLAADDEIPDMEFLEYLGLWEESDEDWLIFDEPITADAEERSDPVPQGEESTETNDES
ncbi:MAG: hypothetical protein OER22_14255 [Gammaproteobacteria bacterium]|nr:hypothetical protein [Gammaproteobacteria bacterium]MDH3372325.1 hypothetical protein [Gammaproteobacteria bacterium]MDH3410519.1 hypothetical protein [Gammaproteobacteria bacterium]MDH3553772.1 hypothetical protein [Gammaproteobacteria bacterium]